MFHNILFILHYAVLLLFGISLSFSFAKVTFNKKNTIVFSLFTLFCGLIQLITYLFLKETFVRQIYPLIVHLPIVVLLCQYFRKRLSTAVSAVATAYLCCQPATILGLLALDFFHSTDIEYLVRIIVYCILIFFIRKYCVPSLSAIFTRDNRSIFTFGVIPIAFYVYDYTIEIYTSIWYTKNELVRELLPTFLFIIFLHFCIAYYHQYTLREAIEQKEQIVALTSEQQRKEIESIKKNSTQLRLLRHDMRHVMENIATCIENNDQEKAMEIISGFTTHIDSTLITRYCENEIMNYVLSAFDSKCNDEGITFMYNVEIGNIPFDEISLSSILSNALDNAYNAQLELPKNKRYIKLMFKYSNGKLLLSVKNPFNTRPIFANGLPTTKRKGHGYGTQSIQFQTEQLGGYCQFTVQDEEFVVRIIL